MSFLQTNFLALSPKTREALSFDLYKQNKLKSTHSTVLQETLKEIKPAAHGNRLLELPRGQAKAELALKQKRWFTQHQLRWVLAENLEERTSSTLIFPY